MREMENQPRQLITLSPDQPIDDIAAASMQTIARKGHGFVLDVASSSRGLLEEIRQEMLEVQNNLADEADKGDIERAASLVDRTMALIASTSIEVKESLPPHDEYEAPAAYRDHQIRDTDSFVAYAKRYGVKENSLVLFNTDRATLVLNEFVARGERETIEMTFHQSPDWLAWASVLNKPLGHRDLMHFLMRQEHNLTEGAVLASMQSLRVNSVINLESDIRDDGKSIGLTVKTNAGEELKNFPKKFDLVLPVLEQDAVDGDRWDKVSVRLNIVLPDDAKKSPTFTLFCSEWQQVLIRRIKKEGDAIRAGLPEWTVVHGQYQVAERELDE